MGITCLFCNHQNSADARFCSMCGSPTDGRPCKQCNAVNKRTAAHCDQCGAPFASSAEADALRDATKANRLASTLMGYDAGATEAPLFRPWSATPLRERGPGSSDEKSIRVSQVSGEGQEAASAGTSNRAHGGDLLNRPAVASPDASSSDATLAIGVQPTRQREPDRAPVVGGPAPSTEPGANLTAARQRQSPARRVRSIVLTVVVLAAGAVILTTLLERDERPVGTEPEVRPTHTEASGSSSPSPSTNTTAGPIAGSRSTPVSDPAAGPSVPSLPEARVLSDPGAGGTIAAPPPASAAGARTPEPEAGASGAATASPSALERQPATVATKPPPTTTPPTAALVPRPRKPYIPPQCSPALAAIGLCSPGAPVAEK